jgi:hypothetical protein
MCDVRKSVVRVVVMGLAVVMLIGTFAPAKAQTNKRKQEAHARRETNATRMARIQRTTEETYSHRYELIGGGGFLRFRNGDYTKKNNEVSWATSLNYYLNQKLAIVGDARGSFGNAYQQQPLYFPQITRPQINEYTFMGGASYRFYAKEKLALSVQGLAGTGWGIFSSGGKGLTGAELGLWNDGFRPAFSVGVSADYNVYPNLALRFTPTWVGTDFAGTKTYVGSNSDGSSNYNSGNASPLQNNLGFNVGVIYRFGHR